MILRTSKRLTTQLALYLAVALIALVILFVITTLTFQSKRIQSQVQQEVLNTTQSYGEGIEYMLGVRIGALEHLAFGIEQEGYELTLNSSTLLGLQSIFDSFWLVDADGQVLEKWPRTLPLEAIHQVSGIAKRKAEKNDSTSDTKYVWISEPLLNPLGEGEPVIQMSIEIADKLGGVFVGNLSIKQNRLLNRSTPVTIRESGFLALSSATGAIIFHPDLAQPLGQLPEEQRILIEESLEGAQTGQVIHEYGGLLWLQTFYRIKNTGWVLAAVLPLEEAMSPLKGLQAILIKQGVLATAVLTVLVFFIVDLKLKPLRTMRKELTLVRNEQLQHISLPGNVELDDLATSFNKLLSANEAQTKQAQQRQAYLDMVLSSSSVGHFMTNIKGTIEYVNEALVTITGLTREQLLQSHIWEYGADKSEGDFDTWWEDAIEGEKKAAITFQFTRQDKTLIWLQLVTQPVFDHGLCLGHVGTVTDVTSQNTELETLRSKIHLDELTGLMNRRGIEQVMSTTWNEARMFNRSLTFMALDLDNFKTVNDQHGHEQGDWVLQQVARLLEQSVRDSDWVARIGGDEFVIVLPQCPYVRAVNIAEKIISEMPNITALRDLPEVTVSIGIAEKDASDQSSLDILRRADKASYQAKHGGRNRWAVAQVD